MKLQLKKSPNFEERPKNSLITTIVIHHTEMPDVESAILRLCDPISKVSCHYIIDKLGNTTQLVPNEFRAWHAGKSFWRNKEAINDSSIGIELDNNGKEPFPHIQIEALIELCAELLKHYPIEQRNIVAHYDIAPDRKDDPNHHFNWELLAQRGIGIFPKIIIPYPSHLISSISEVQKKLNLYGYKIDVTAKLDLQTKAVIIAFKRHFCTESFLRGETDKWDLEADLKLNELLRMIDEKD